MLIGPRKFINANLYFVSHNYSNNLVCNYVKMGKNCADIDAIKLIKAFDIHNWINKSD